MIHDQIIEPTVVMTVAIPTRVAVYGSLDEGYWWECQNPDCSDVLEEDPGPANEAILGAALHSYSHDARLASEGLQDALSVAAGRRYTIRYPARSGGGDVVVTQPGGLDDVQVRCEHCGWEWQGWSQPWTHAAAAVHAACAHTTHTLIPAELLNLFDEALAPRLTERVNNAVYERVDRAVSCAVANAEKPLRKKIDELQSQLQTTRSERWDAQVAYNELVGNRSVERLTKEIDRTDAQIARSDVKPGITLTGIALALPEGVKQLTSGELPLTATIVGIAAAATAAVGAITLIVSVVPRISAKWGEFGLVTVAEMSEKDIAKRAHDLAVDPRAATDAAKLQSMAKLAMQKHRLVRMGMLITLLGAAPLALLATIIALTA